MSKPFLTARWSNLLIASYAISPDLLSRCVPPWLEPDIKDGRAFVSLVGFDFRDTRVLGVSWPGFRDFPELNLRAYVRCGPDRGVIFVREIVESSLVAWLARTIYNEPYLAAPLQSKVSLSEPSISVDYRLTWKGKQFTMSVAGSREAVLPREGSDEHFFKEHRWGFGVSANGRPLRYEVVHPLWNTHPIQSFDVNLDWEQVYGSPWSLLNDAAPHSVILAEGSPVTVYPPKTLSL